MARCTVHAAAQRRNQVRENQVPSAQRGRRHRSAMSLPSNP